MSYQKGSFGATVMLMFGPNDILIVLTLVFFLLFFSYLVFRGKNRVISLSYQKGSFGATSILLLGPNGILIVLTLIFFLLLLL
jgi:hypothetical protein